MLMNNRRKKDGHNASDLDSSESSVGLQCVGGGGLAAGALGVPVSGPALSGTAVTGLAAKQRTQTRAKVGKRRMAACFDGRPRRPVQQTVSPCWLSAACGSPAPCMSSTAADTAGSVADVAELTTLQTDGNKCILFHCNFLCHLQIDITYTLPLLCIGETT